MEVLPGVAARNVAGDGNLRRRISYETMPVQTCFIHHLWLNYECAGWVVVFIELGGEADKRFGVTYASLELWGFCSFLSNIRDPSKIFLCQTRH